MECRKCTYYDKKKNLVHGGTVIVGYCRLREKHISDATVGKQLCKDKAVIDVDPSKLKKHEELRLQDLSSKVWSGKKSEVSTF
jgi:hypothetical protein